MVTIISTTNRPGSSTLKLAQYYQKKLHEKGVESNLFSLIELPANLIQTDLYGKRSDEFQKIQDIMTQTQKFLFIIPEYNGCFPGVLKVFIDAYKAFKEPLFLDVAIKNANFIGASGQRIVK